MPRKITVILAIIVGLLVVLVAWLFMNQVKIKQTVYDVPVTDTMVFTEGMMWVTPVPLPDTVDFAGEVAPLDIFYVKEQLERELTVNTYWHSSTLLLIKRAARWFPVIEPILKQQGIPDDFKYLALIESGLMNVVSPSGAAGFWQFLEKTGKEYGLEVNKEVDERYHVVKATEAACGYIRKSNEKFNNWTLVAASYNAGMKRISETISNQGTSDYYEMYLNEETSRYIFRILAIKLIVENPEKYGFRILEGDFYNTLDYKFIEVNKTITKLPAFARENGTSYRMLKEYNPWLRSDKLTIKKGRSYQLAFPR